MTTQRAASLTWKRCEPPVDDMSIGKLEDILGVKFPPDFRQVIQRCHGGVPVERSEFYYQDPTLGTVGSGIGALLNLNIDDADDSILATVSALTRTDQLPLKVIPFAEDGGGDMMCLAYRDDPEHPRVVYWSHEAPKETSIAPLADSFGEFLDSLQPPVETDALPSKQRE